MGKSAVCFAKLLALLIWALLGLILWPPYLFLGISVFIVATVFGRTFGFSPAWASILFVSSGTFYVDQFPRLWDGGKPASRPDTESERAPRQMGWLKLFSSIAKTLLFLLYCAAFWLLVWTVMPLPIRNGFTQALHAMQEKWYSQPELKPGAEPAIESGDPVEETPNTTSSINMSTSNTLTTLDELTNRKHPAIVE